MKYLKSLLILKDFLYFNQIWVGIPRGLLGILASWSVFGNAIQPLPLAVGIIAMTFLIGGSITKDIIDSEADKKTGVHTLINTLGSRKTALICFPFIFFPFTFIPIFINQGLLEGYLWPLTFVVVLSFIILYLMVRETESKTLENVQAWSIMYTQYIFFALGFAILTIFSDALPF